MIKRIALVLTLALLVAAGVGAAGPVNLTIWTHTHAPANEYLQRLVAL